MKYISVFWLIYHHSSIMLWTTNSHTYLLCYGWLILQPHFCQVLLNNSYISATLLHIYHVIIYWLRTTHSSILQYTHTSIHIMVYWFATASIQHVIVYWFTTTFYNTVTDTQPNIHHILICNLSHNHSVNSTLLPIIFWCSDCLTIIHIHTNPLCFSYTRLIHNWISPPPHFVHWLTHMPNQPPF